MEENISCEFPEPWDVTCEFLARREMKVYQYLPHPTSAKVNSIVESPKVHEGFPGTGFTEGYITFLCMIFFSFFLSTDTNTVSLSTHGPFQSQQPFHGGHILTAKSFDSRVRFQSFPKPPHFRPLSKITISTALSSVDLIYLGGKGVFYIVY